MSLFKWDVARQCGTARPKLAVVTVSSPLTVARSPLTEPGEILFGRRVVGLQFERALEMRDGLGLSTKSGQNPAEIAVRRS